jgi:hypothetical protein
MLDKFVTTVAARLAAALTPVIVAKIEEYAPIIAERLLTLLPIVVASATKAVFDRIPQLELHDIDLSDLINIVRDDMNQIPDIDIPILSDRFDLTEMFNRHRRLP